MCVFLLTTNTSFFFFSPAARVLSCVRVVCLRSVFVVRASSSMKRGKKAEEAVAEGENDTGAGTTATTKSLYIKTFPISSSPYKVYI